MAALELLGRGLVPSLVVIGESVSDPSGSAVAAAIRLGPPASATVPIIACGGIHPGDPLSSQASGFDGWLPAACTLDDVLAAAAAWRPDDSGAILARLERELGATIRSMAARFALLLGEALSTLGEGGGRDIAHRVAGIAGTLGFAAAGRAWLAIADGDDSAREDAYRESRRAIAAISRHLNADDAATSV